MLNFNTSNVTIQLFKDRVKSYRASDFNTSNVTIQPAMQEKIRKSIIFQYI